MRTNLMLSVKKRACLLLVALLLALPTFAQTLKVAAAANLQGIMTVLQKDFKQKTGISIDPIVGSSGKLVAQIRNGAPFDVFLSADMSFPNTLFKEGLSTKAPIVYAYGSLVICSNKDIGFENWTRTLLTPRIKKIAIANPDIAPYGFAAKELLLNKGILDDVQNKIVYGESISQVNTYITTGVVEVGFTTQALVKDPANKTPLFWKEIDPKTYTPIKQGIVILKRAANNPDAEKFYQYILSVGAKRIFEQYGYRIQ
jgi:molybdate transport system substrate-binding protein